MLCHSPQCYHCLLCLIHDLYSQMVFFQHFQIKCNTQCKINEENTGSSLSMVDPRPVSSELESNYKKGPGYQLQTHHKLELESEVVQKTKKLPVFYLNYGSFRISSEDLIQIFTNLVKIFFWKFTWQIFNNQ